MPQTCSRKQHRWSADGRRCLRCGARRTRMPKKPSGLTRLAYGQPRCELCKQQLKPGDSVGWWYIEGSRWTVYCETCHSSCRRARRALR